MLEFVGVSIGSVVMGFFVALGSAFLFKNTAIKRVHVSTVTLLS